MGHIGLDLQFCIGLSLATFRPEADLPQSLDAVGILHEIVQRRAIRLINDNIGWKEFLKRLGLVLWLGAAGRAVDQFRCVPQLS